MKEDHEISIYDSTSSAEKTEAGDSQEPTHSFTYSPSDKKALIKIKKLKPKKHHLFVLLHLSSALLVMTWIIYQLR